MTAQRFCELCDVDLGLHGTDTPSDDGFDCQIANRKADLLYDMDRVFGTFG